MTTKDTTYNGHKTRGHWNVALWIGNDEGLYHLALECKRGERTATIAAKCFIEGVGGGATPDGYDYTIDRVRAALAGLE